MATKTRDIAPLVKGKRSPNTSKTKSLVHTNAINLIASNRNNTYLKSKVSSGPDKTQAKKPAPLTYPSIHHKQTLNHRTSNDKPPSSLHNTQVKKNPPLSNDLNINHNKLNVARGSSFDNRPCQPSSLGNTQGKKLASSLCVPPNIHNKQTIAQRRLSFDNRPPQSSSLDHNTQAKKVASSISNPNIHNKQTLARRRLSFDHRPPPSSFRDNSPQSKKLAPKSDHNIHSTQTPTRHKPPLSSPLLKNRTSPNPRERIHKPSLSSSSKNSTSQKSLLNKLSKAPHPSYKNVVLKQHGAGLYARTVSINNTITKKKDSSAGLTTKDFNMTSNLTDIVENIDPHEDEELEQEEHQELVIEDHGELSEIVNIDEYLKAAESSSLYVVENQEDIKMEVPEEQQLVEETSIKNHKELEEIKNLEPSNLDLEEIEKQECGITTQNEKQEEKEEGEESVILVKALDDCQQEKVEGKELNLDIDQEEKEESEGRNNKEKEEINKNKISTTTMAFAKAYPHLVQGKNNKESVVSNDVIEETASKLREQRKNRVKALASAFETVISLKDPK
ncbi:hypothetical protein RND71_004774 [Anisodus tanguticus]|uniref:Calmodulin-binding domain-containing protein n=1 Tax=Anisodus tanguticus TaxID=243964 RepID=A0AAE1SQ75_9SOLA|nr:hypothetical protein RND71_004774 [Anisodus tanguticus]